MQVGCRNPHDSRPPGPIARTCVSLRSWPVTPRALAGRAGCAWVPVARSGLRARGRAHLQAWDWRGALEMRWSSTAEARSADPRPAQGVAYRARARARSHADSAGPAGQCLLSDLAASSGWRLPWDMPPPWRGLGSPFLSTTGLHPWLLYTAPCGGSGASLPSLSSLPQICRKRVAMGCTKRS